MDERVEKMNRYITGCMILPLISAMSFLTGCGNDTNEDFAETTESSETMEKVESDEDSIMREKVDITQNKSEIETRQEEIDPAEVYELFLNGELTVAQEVRIKREGEPEEEQLTIDELFWGNDIEYCFLDIDGDGSEELHIRDDIVYYAIKAVNGTPQIFFDGRWNCEPVVTDQACGILHYYNHGYGYEGIQYTQINADGSTESDGEFYWSDKNKNGIIDAEDFFRGGSDWDEIDMVRYVQYREEQMAKQTENELEWMDKRLKDFATWQEAYIDYINKPESTIWTSENDSDYSLIYVDDDDIPELYIRTGFMVSGEFVVSFYDGKVRALNRERGGIEYMEYGGLFYSDWGNMGFYPCDVYMLERGEFSEIGTGWLSEARDEENPDNWGFDYFWEGSLMTETEYEECLNKLIDTTQCIEPAELYTQDEMLKILAEGDVL